MLTKQQKAQLTERVHECIEIAKEHYNRDFHIPHIRFDLRGTTAGWAQDHTWTLNFNNILASENMDEFLNDTVPHEVAHLIDGVVYPETRQRSWGQKRSLHGSTWKSVMRVLGADPTRCHTMDVTNARVRQKVRHEWICDNCGTSMILGPKRHKKMITGVSRYYKRGSCISHTYSYKGIVGDEQLPVAASKPAPKKTTKKKVTKKARSGSKKDLARAIFNKMQGQSRGTIIQQFIDALDMSKAGASTYYANFNNGTW